MFLAWYSCSEPGELTGLPEGPQSAEIFRAIFQDLEGAGASDPEVLFTVGLMASMFPYCCGDEHLWSTIGEDLNRRYDDLPATERMNSDTFRGRGAYGQYFSQVGKDRW